MHLAGILWTLARQVQGPMGSPQHVGLIVTLAVAALWFRWLGIYLSYDWWGTVVVFLAMVSNIFVNIGCPVFFCRSRRREFNWFCPVPLPIIGLATSPLLLCFPFGLGPWSAGWQRG